MGWVPVHFWGKEIKKRTEECVEAIEDLIFELRIMALEDMAENVWDNVEDMNNLLLI